MKVLACIDTRGGMLFNDRRQSRDRLVTLDMLVEAGREKLYITPFSEKLFRGNLESVNVVEDLFEGMDKNRTMFVETHDLYDMEKVVDTLVLYCWNKEYPYDMVLAIDLECYERVSSVKFEGYSHEWITKDTYVRKDLLVNETLDA